MGGLCGPHENERTDWCQKQTILNVKSVPICPPDTNIKKGYFNLNVYRISLYILLSLSVTNTRFSEGKNKCVYVGEKTNTPHWTSVLPGWVIRSVFPRLPPAQCPGSLHKAGGTSPRKLLLWWKEKRVISSPSFVLDLGVQRDISALIAPQTKWPQTKRVTRENGIVRVTLT